MKRRLSLFLTIVMMLSLITVSAFSVQANAQESMPKTLSTTEFVHLTDVPDGYVGIYTKSDLDNIRNNLSGNYILMNDIDFSTDDFSEVGQFYNSGKGWNSIGNNETPFTGIFDGNGYCINDLNISGGITESLYVGLFGYNKGTIKNIVTVSGQIDITHASNTVYVGMVAGYSEGTIENCKSFGEVNVESTILRATYETPYSYVGGITGYSVGTLSLCENTCNIQATPSVISYAEAVAYLGGVAGIANTSTVSNCTNSGAITLTPSLGADTGITVYAGGILGQSNGNTSGCDNSGSVIIEEFKASSTSSVAIKAKFYVAGIIGYSNGTITGSNNAGTIRARGVYAYSGGVAGYNAGTLSQCSNIGNIMAITTSTGSAAYSYGYSGGIAGYSTGTTSESYNTGFVEVKEAGASEAAYSGGIVSYQKDGTITNCYNAGFVPDKTYYGDTGGIAGYSTGSISLCYNIGRVPYGGGAIVGYTSRITPNCFFLNDNKVGVAEGKDSTISCSKEALLLAETYTGFDFNSVWEIGIYDTYPCATLKNVEHKGSAIGNDLFAGGTGTAYDPFLIENAEQLSNIRAIPSAYYELITDIAFNDSDYAEGGAFYNDGEGWLPIMYFVGSFDGRGHVINNLQIYHAPTSSVSSYSSSNAHYARFYDDCFGLFGFNCGGTISKVGVIGDIYVKKFNCPGFLDYAYVGGIAGRSNGTISECYFMGSVYGTAEYSSQVGGICGWSWDPEGTLENCFSKGTFTGPTTNAVGGITGGGSYSNCYSTGRVVKKGSSSNIAMVRGSGDAVNCTEAEMRVQSTYTDFDFNSIWTMEGNPKYPYPELKNVNTFYDKCDHSFTKEDTTYLKSEATCTSPAVYYKSCAICGEKGTETFEHGATAEHSYTKQVTTDAYKKSSASCTAKAVYYYCCETCDAKGTTTYEHGSTLAHNYTRKVVTDTYKKSAATCTDAAVYYYCCATCDAKGTTTYTNGSELGHTGGTATCTAKAECTRCHQPYGNMLEHVYTDQDASTTYLKSAATCTSKAVYYKNCATCDKAGTATFEYGDFKAHSYIEKVEDAYLKASATCTSKAVYYKSCSDCGVKGTKTFEVGDAPSHNYQTTWSSDETSHWHECSKCGDKKDNASHIAGAAATESTAQTCTVCGYVITPALGHTHNFNSIKNDETNHWKECACGEKKEITAHTWNNGEVTKEATIDEEGVKTYTCTLCSCTKNESIAKLVTNVKDTESGVTLEIPSNSQATLPAGTVIEVVEKSNESISEQILGEFAATAETVVEALGVYDLNLLLDGVKIQPNGAVVVTLPAPKFTAEYDRIIVVFIADDGSYDECKTTVNADGTISFETDHFSKYAVIGVNEEEADDRIGVGAIIAIVVGAVLVVGGGAFAIYWFVIKKKNKPADDNTTDAKGPTNDGAEDEQQ